MAQEVLEFFNPDLGKEGTAYVTNFEDGKKCTRFDTFTDFPKVGVPEEANFTSYQYIGSRAAADESVELNQWRYKSPLFGGDWFYLTYTTKGCLPVRHDNYNSRGGYQYMQFSDVVLGSSDPNRWTPPEPADCPRADKAQQAAYFKKCGDKCAAGLAAKRKLFPNYGK